jgi:hypothetical protein
MAASTNPEVASAASGAPAGVDGVEIKVTLRPDQELRGLRSLKLDEETAEVRVITFFDTPGLDLFHAGVALRARLVKGDADDSTVKMRPVDPARVSPKWHATEGFKLEADQTGDQTVCSASLTAVQDPKDIDAVGEGHKPIETIFTKEQVLFLSEFSPDPVVFDRLRPLGPIRVLRWKTKHKGFPHELTTEEWRLPDGEDLVEVSIKVEPAEAAAAFGAFEEHLRSLGLDPEGAQATKTRTALEYFASHLPKPG